MGGDHPNPAVRQLQAQLAAARAQHDHGRPARGRDRGDEGQEEVAAGGGGGGGGGGVPATPEGQPGQPLDLQRPLDQLVELLVQFLGGGRREGSSQSSANEDSDEHD